MSQELIGQVGWIRNVDRTGYIQCRVLSVDPLRKCPKCGGPWGDIEVVKTTTLSGSNLTMQETTASGCLNDLRYEQDPSNQQLMKDIMELERDNHTKDFPLD